MTTSSASEVVILKSGLSVPVGALRLLWHLEERGLSLEAADDGALIVRPRGHLDAEEQAQVRTHRDHLLRLVRCCGSVQ